MDKKLQRTPLYERHVQAGGRMVDFAGWELPVQYASALEEHCAVRSSAGLFDISHMGEFSLRGKNSLTLLEWLIPTSLAKLENNKAMYTCLCNSEGGVIDDLFIFRISQDEYYLVVNAGSLHKDFKWIQQNLASLNEKNAFNSLDTILEDQSDDTAKLDIQGPAAPAIIKKIFGNLQLERFHFIYTDYRACRLMISNTGYTGEVGYELYVPSKFAEQLWDELLQAGKPEGLIPCGLAARDSLRLEAAYSLYGHELSEKINPVEAGLAWVITSDKDYIGADALRKAKELGTERKIFCIEVEGRGIPREGYSVHYGGQSIGHVTSGGYSPTLKKGIALAMLKTANFKIGCRADIIIRDKPISAIAVKRPFYQYKG